MSVNRIIKLPDFEKFYSFRSDIAMLQLRLTVNFTFYVVPACLPPKDAQLHNHTSCWITGCGMLSADSLDCWHPIYPSVFTRVTYFTDWISQVKGLTPLTESESVSPHTELKPRPLRTAVFPQTCSIFIVAQIWFLLVFIPEAQDQAP
ncbi:hypothetical protein U0070_023610, partial [Myodes glareolus]